MSSAGASFPITRFFATADGGSRFEDVTVPLTESRTDPFGNRYPMTLPLDVSNAAFVELPDGLDQDWHTAPNRQLVFVLSGTLEVETTEGEVRRWGQGSLVMADDTKGKGHRTRVLEGPAKLVFLRLPDDFRFPAVKEVR
jgi:quercetin dioxygenase-like cupin family protein